MAMLLILVATSAPVAHGATSEETPTCSKVDDRGTCTMDDDHTSLLQTSVNLHKAEEEDANLRVNDHCRFMQKALDKAEEEGDYTNFKAKCQTCHDNCLDGKQDKCTREETYCDGWVSSEITCEGGTKDMACSGTRCEEKEANRCKTSGGSRIKEIDDSPTLETCNKECMEDSSCKYVFYRVTQCSLHKWCTQEEKWWAKGSRYTKQLAAGSGTKTFPDNSTEACDP